MNADPTILQMKYASVVEELARVAGVGYDAALRMFYESETYGMMREGVSDLHCMSEWYLAEEILEERSAESRDK